MAITAASLTQGIGNALKGALCLSLNVTEPLGSIAVPLIRFAATGAGTIEGEAGLSLINGIQRTRNYLRQFACDEDPATAPPWDFGPGFTGGQCPGQQYDVTTVTSGTSLQGQPFADTRVRRVPGPIRGTNIERVIIGTNTEWVVTLLHGGSPNFSVLTRPFAPTSSPFSVDECLITTITPFPAGPDNCGDPPPIIPEGSDEEGGEIDIIGEDENGDPIVLPDVPFVLFQPTLNVNGDLVVNVNLPTLDICGFFNFGPDGGFTPASCGPTNSPPPTPDDEPKGDGDTEPDPELDDEDPEDEVEEGKTIQATVIKSQRLINNISQTQIPGGEGPTILFPRIATISWKVERQLESETIDGWTRPVDVQSVNAWYEAPKDGRVVATSVVWQPNWEGTYQNVKAPYPKPCCGTPPPAPQLPPA